MFKQFVSVLVASALVSACASPETAAKYNVALDRCLASEDVDNSNECKKAEILREQVEFERHQNAGLAVGVAAVGFFTLGIISVVSDCCRGHRHYRGHRRHHY